jgi:predicted ATPase
VSFGSAIPYLPILDLLRRICFIGETDPPDAVRARVRATLRDLGLGDEQAPYLLQLLDAGEAGATLENLPPEATRTRTFEAVRHLILALSRRTPLVIAMEDLHWIDRTSEQFLVSLMEAVANAPILLVATYRPGYRPPWIGRSYATQIALPPLAPPEGATVRCRGRPHRRAGGGQSVLHRGAGARPARAAR